MQEKRYRFEPITTSFGDTSLSLMAMGILAYLTFESRLHPVAITADELLLAKPDNERGEVIAALEELETAGYIKEAQ